MEDDMDWTQIGPFSDTPQASILTRGLVPCENDSFIELIASGRRWPISRACVNRLPCLAQILLDIECDSTQQHRVRHELLETAGNVNGSRKTRKCQVFLIDEPDADNFGDLVTALHCLNGSRGLATIAEASRQSGNILNLLELCHKYMFASLANQCRRNLARWLLDASESTLEEVATVASMFDTREADDVDGSFGDKNEHDILSHPVMLAVLRRLRLASADELTDISCCGIPTYLLLKLIVFAGNGSATKRTMFADALIVRMIQLENKHKPSSKPWSGWNLVALNLCRSNMWTNTRIMHAIEALWIESLSDSLSPASSPTIIPRLERSALTPQRRAISDSRHDRPKKLTNSQQRRSRAQSFNALLHSNNINNNVVHMTVNVDVTCPFDERSALDKRVCSQTIPLHLTSSTTDGVPTQLSVALFMIRDVSTENHAAAVHSTYSYRLCIKLLAQADATFSGVIGIDTHDSGVEECHLVNKKISAEPLVATVLQRETRCVSSIPLRIYGTLTVSSQ